MRAILRGRTAETCPVRALDTWLEASGISSGPLFCSVSRHGHVGNGLTPRAVALVVKCYAELAGLEVADFAGHSLRAGFVTSAAERGVARRADRRPHRAPKSRDSPDLHAPRGRLRAARGRGASLVHKPAMPSELLGQGGLPRSRGGTSLRHSGRGILYLPGILVYDMGNRCIGADGVARRSGASPTGRPWTTLLPQKSLDTPSSPRIDVGRPPQQALPSGFGLRISRGRWKTPRQRAEQPTTWEAPRCVASSRSW